MATTPKKAAEKKPEAEVSRRSADGSSGTRHLKVFVVSGSSPLPETDGPEHEDNKAACAQEAIQRGLHPRGEPKLDGVEGGADGSREFTYSVSVVPASMDAEAPKTTTPRDIVMDDGARARELSGKKAQG
ncbi:hypothetical protein K378_01441 [Streptomyces sp. Amel2xB2]|uniref:hypothetical protein n=1 Tax=Streptomyces sp. Amel2xB2 TaxID=1305829 RepID=UPI000DBA5E70|nr:hypothetical protein [Streptomyces sp. Amel2xB2]RAJ70276.1 hypothetical protein K378_01441 [Streptomyces sp. Amel2xB2]